MTTQNENPNRAIDWQYFFAKHNSLVEQKMKCQAENPRDWSMANENELQQAFEKTMELRKQVLAEGTEVGPWKVDEYDKAKPVFTVETYWAVYTANTLTEAMRLWASYAMAPEIADTIDKRDSTTVLNVGRIG